MARLSGLQREVLSLYRRCLREIQKKPTDTRGNFQAYARAEFRKHRSVNKKDFNAIEYLLRKGHRQVEMYSSPGIRNIHPRQRVTPAPSFSPRFDVYELDGSYHLDGELPGVEQSNLDIEFTDPHTIVIKGRVERQYNDTASDASEAVDERTDDTSSSKSLQPTVEDDDDEASATATRESSASASHPATAPRRSGSAFKYWALERSLGQFHRTFSFPTRVDQDAVRASLRNGIISVILPKEAAPKLKKIRVE
ncbi:HSP20-like chaperone [Aspergillus steynii IBT 23096]|uniref:HSP20-like chaperone n=1 Tax=Aspergillus steynii IBT 23096 TaxID=1392250 RepID=A0A2I2G293_9EURO|nr:HSP20-like chaperone [Aspergillus steynii IBT 23096]PLB46985.1 HSP20-like chaperone [Aspergillus steynii IBT 23096]